MSNLVALTAYSSSERLERRLNVILPQRRAIGAHMLLSSDYGTNARRGVRRMKVFPQEYWQ
jgi:hypothetical protein